MVRGRYVGRYVTIRPWRIGYVVVLGCLGYLAGGWVVVLLILAASSDLEDK